MRSSDDGVVGDVGVGSQVWVVQVVRVAAEVGEVMQVQVGSGVEVLRLVEGVAVVAVV